MHKRQININFKMANETSLENIQEIRDNNHAILGEIVAEYHLIIKPALLQGNLTGIQMIIPEICMELDHIVESSEGGHRENVEQKVDGCYWNCKAAFATINEAVKQRYEGERLDYVIKQAEARFKLIDNQLGNDTSYRQGRGKI